MRNPFQNIFSAKGGSTSGGKGKVVIVGIGNLLRSDDGLGVVLIQRLKDKIKAPCIDVGTAPENYAGSIAKEAPDTILLVDALHLDLAPGKYEILKKQDILNSGFSTHDLSPKMFIEYLEKTTKANIYLLGVQPASVAFGEELSAEVETTLKRLEKLIYEVTNA